MFKKTYELPLSRDYVRHWGVAEAVRELLQNALDSDSPLEYSWGPDSLSITSRHAKLEPHTLLLGRTSKADAKDKIGSFGEGYKIALLVLTREDRPVVVYNNDVTWKSEFRTSRAFGAEVLTISEDKYPEGRGKGLTFVISNLSDQDVDAIKSATLQMQESIGEVAETSYGQILLQRPGALYVNGLFVCETEFKHSYNIKPEFLRLERDRQTVNSFDLAFLTKNMWFESGRTDKVVELIADNAPDLAYANYGTPDIVKEACYQHFRAQYPDQILAETKQELDSLVKKGMTKTVFIGGGPYTSIVRESSSYKHTTPVQVMPSQALQEWFSTNRQHMRTPAIVSFKQLLQTSQEWKP